MGGVWKQFEGHVKQSLNHLEETSGRSLDFKHADTEGSEGTCYWKLKEVSSFVVAENLGKISLTIMCQAEHLLHSKRDFQAKYWRFCLFSCCSFSLLFIVK